MSACPSNLELTAWLEDSLKTPQRDGVAVHVNTCKSCQARLDTLTDESGLATSSFKESNVGRPTEDADGQALIDLVLRLKGGGLSALSARRRDDLSSDHAGDEALSFPEPPTPDAPLGRLAEYDILERLGTGGTGQVFKARDTRLGRIVAIKVLREELAARRNARIRFEREARACAALRNDHVVTIHEVGNAAGFPPWLVMQFIAGESLTDRIRREGAVPAEDAAELVLQVCLGLEAAHEAGIVHRDIKSSNVLVDTGGRAMLADFGLARVADQDSEITHEGMLAGTPAYMSPEQIQQPHRVDQRSDVYSTSVVLYELLTGVLPFRGVTRTILHQVLNDDPRPPRRWNAAIPRDLQTVCLKAMERDPSRRYPTARDMADDLARYLDGHPVQARPLGRIARLARWRRRNPRIAMLTGIIAVMLIAGIVGWTNFTVSLSQRVQEIVAANKRTLRQEQRALGQEQLARAAAAEAERNEAEAIRNLRFSEDALTRMVFEVVNRLEGHPELESLPAEVLNIAIEGLAGMSDAAESKASSQLRQAIARDRLGDRLLQAGYVDLAKEQLERASELAHGLQFEHPDDPGVHQCLAWCSLHAGDLHALDGHLLEAHTSYWQAATWSRQIIDAQHVRPEAVHSLAVALDRIGTLAAKSGDYAEAASTLTAGLETLESFRQAGTTSPDSAADVQLTRALAVIRLKLASIEAKLEQHDKAETKIIEAIGLLEGLQEAVPDRHDLILDHVAALITLAELRRDTGRTTEAFDSATAALEMLNRPVIPDSKQKARLKGVCTALLGEVCCNLQRYIAAKGYLMAALERLQEPTEPDRQSLQAITTCLTNLIFVNISTGSRFQAEQRLQEFRHLIDSRIRATQEPADTAFQVWLDEQLILMDELSEKIGSVRTDQPTVP